MIAVCFALMFGATLTAAEEPKELTTVTFRMSWHPDSDYAPFLLAGDKGFYAEEGLEVEVLPGRGSVLSTKLVAIEENDFGLASGSTTLIARTKGMPLKVLAIVKQKSPASVVYRKDLGIKSPKDLEGKTVACAPQSTKRQQFIAFCKKQGVDIEKITFVSVSTSQEIKLLLSGKVDAALMFSDTIDAILKKKGLSEDFEKMLFDDYGIHLYGHTIITHENMVKNHPDLVRKFVKATVRAWEYAINHPEEAIDVLIKYYPEIDKASELDKFRGELQLSENEVTEEHGFGYQTKERWEEVQDLLYGLEIIKTKIDVTTLYTNEFLE